MKVLDSSCIQCNVDINVVFDILWNLSDVNKYPNFISVTAIICFSPGSLVSDF